MFARWRSQQPTAKTAVANSIGFSSEREKGEDRRHTDDLEKTIRKDDREHNRKLSTSIRCGQSKQRESSRKNPVSMMVASSMGSHTIVSHVLQFGGVAGYPIIDILNNPAQIAFRPPLSFLEETRAVSHENAEIVGAGRGSR
jgi:hypothetical protein